ncbi:putative bifunctional diguanylate cyclase/phosphodiesterase [Roseateles sp. BYS180W]|uniref:Bifunctional diguanylate cyclase/phosphodiesterase n=1 Tax=Roseateles rivi TaxID=3299028 RepID=A0ABW7FV03_9BURK
MPFTPSLQEAPPQLLLVDDDPLCRTLTAAALEAQGFAVSCCDNGLAALRSAAQQRPDLVLLDALMPGLDGFQTCELLRSSHGLEDLPVLMLTVLDDDAAIEQAYRAGATDFFVKSNHWTLLAGRLRHLLRSARTQVALQRSQSRLARAQQLARMGSFEWLRLPRLGPAFQLSTEALQVLGLQPQSRRDFIGLLRLFGAAQRHVLMRQLRSAWSMRSPLQLDLTLGSEVPRTIHLEAEPQFDALGRLSGYSGIVQDVSERRQAEARIRQLNNYDPLTRLPNRHQLQLRAERALDAARQGLHPMGVLMVDLDRFKNINDHLGYQAGDALLVAVAERLRSCIQHVNTMPAPRGSPQHHRLLEGLFRLGSDEFVVLLPDLQDVAQAEDTAQRLLQSLREPFNLGGRDCFVTASVGTALYPRDGNSLGELLRNADLALNAAKAQGRNVSAMYAPHLRSGDWRERLELDNALHKAVERDELLLHYQPKIDVRRAECHGLVGMEALMRWQHGQRMVPPDEFIPLAEDSGLIVPLSEWALRQAARQARRWLQQFGFEGSIAVNLPTRMFERTDLVELIHSCAREADVPHRMLQLEITETGLMKDLQSVIPALYRLNEIGVQVAIDDFGTGYSSLAYLTTLPIAEVKIDRSFVRGLGSTPQSTAVAGTIVTLGRSLNLRVVAEGVENLTQMQILHTLGCHQMQGFLFSQPQAAPELEPWLAQCTQGAQISWLAGAAQGPSASPLPQFVQSSLE